METYLASRRDGLPQGVLWLYGLCMLLSNAAYLFGYYLLPEGFMRSSLQVAVGKLAATGAFWSELALAFCINLGWAALLAVVCNFNQVRGFPVGYLLPGALGITTGLISGTNSFGASDLAQINAPDGMALGLSIGNLEMLAYILIIASTIAFSAYQYRSRWRWSGEWKPVNVMNLRDVRLSSAEVARLVSGILLLLVAAYRETLMVLGA